MAFREKTVSSIKKYNGNFLQVYEDAVELSDGTHTRREHIMHPGAALIIAKFPNKDTLLIKQYRYALKRVFTELPAGKIDKNETPEATARRELAEETGYHAELLTHIHTFYPCIGYSDEIMHLYLAENLSRPSTDKNTHHSTDPGEDIELERLSYQDALHRVNTKQIQDLKSIAGILLSQEYFS